MSIVVRNYDDNAVSVPPAQIRLQVDGLPQTASRVLATQFRIDRHHPHPYTAWKAMGSPQHPTPEQIEKLKTTGQQQLLISPQ